MRDVDLAYLAGVIDADGYVTGTRSTRRGATYYGAQVGITGSCREPHDLAVETFGGKVSCHQPGSGRDHHRMQYHWQVGGRRAVPVIQAVLPYLRVKRTRAILVIELQESLNERRAAISAGEDPYPWYGPDHDPTHAFEALIEDIRGAKTGVTVAAGRELDGRTHDGYPVVA